MKEFADDELFLQGRLQFEIAIGALAHTGLNPDAQARLQTLLDLSNQSGDARGLADPTLFIQGETIRQQKADIVASLGKIANDKAATSVHRIAAKALQEIL